MSEVPKLGYWKIRGLAQPIRHMYAFLGVKYEEVLYEQGDAPEFNNSVWTDHKPDMDFPNLPYLIHKDIKMSETFAIMRYIARTYKKELLGASETDMAFVDQMEGVLKDIKGAMTVPMYTHGDMTQIIDIINQRFEKVSKYLGEKNWLVGDLSIADFYFAEMVDIAQYFTKNAIGEKFPNLKSYLERFQQLTGVKEFIQTNETQKFTFNNKCAKVNN